MKISKSAVVFVLLILAFFGWQIAGQYDVLAATLGLPGSARLSAEDQYIIS